MVNAAGSPTFYEFDSTELLALYKEMGANDEEPVVVYHSHTATEAYPSRTDIGLASEPGAHYVLVSTREHGNNEGPVGVQVLQDRRRRGDRGRASWSSPSRLPTRCKDRGVHSWPSRSAFPTILRTYTGGRRPSPASGRLSALIDDLEANHPGIKERLVEDGDLRRFVNVYVNDEDVRFIGGLDAEVTDGDQVVGCPPSPAG